MPNKIKFTTESVPGSLSKGNARISTGGDVGPTHVSGFYNGITPPVNGYTFYMKKTGGIVEDGLVFAIDAGHYSSYRPELGLNEVWDLSGNGNNSTLVNGVGYDSTNGGSFVFDGTNDYIIDNNYIDLKPLNISVCSWVKGIPSSYDAIVCHSAWSGGYTLWFHNNDYPDFRINNVPSTSSINCRDNQWHFLVGTYDKTYIKIYVDGCLENIIPYTSDINYNNYMSIGCSYENELPQHIWNGNISNVLIYNKSLTYSEIVQNYNSKCDIFSKVGVYIDDTTDGGGWIRFWWYMGQGWPNETDTLGYEYGTFAPNSPYGFQRLPSHLTKENTELLAKDDDGNIYKWDFSNTSNTSTNMWNSLINGTTGIWANGGIFNPTVISGSFHNVPQDSWMYREEHGVYSFLLDDDTCDCQSTLNAGHAMCGSTWNQLYALPDGAEWRYGVDSLNGSGCYGPLPNKTLELYYRIKN